MEVDRKNLRIVDFSPPPSSSHLLHLVKQTNEKSNKIAAKHNIPM